MLLLLPFLLKTNFDEQKILDRLPPKYRKRVYMNMYSKVWPRSHDRNLRALSGATTRCCFKAYGVVNGSS